jgi:hypothetical protein
VAEKPEQTATSLGGNKARPDAPKSGIRNLKSFLGGFAKSLGDLLTRCGRFFHEMRISRSRDAGDFFKSLGGVGRRLGARLKSGGRAASACVN